MYIFFWDTRYKNLAIENIARLARLEALFHSRVKYLYVVICASDGTYNHLTYFDEKLKYEDRTTRYGLRI